MSAEDDRKATETVLRVLRHPSISKLSFKATTTIQKGPVVSVSTRTVSPVLYDEVCKAIVDRKITVLVQPTILPPGAAAAYLHKLTIDADNEWYDIIILGKPDLGNTAPEQVKTAAEIVHECTHAGYDLLKLPKTALVEHEVGAYVAGALFAAEAMVLLKAHPERVSGLQGTAKAAWDIALLELADQPVPRALYDKLALAIRSDPLYRDHANDDLVNDGVGKAWKIKGAGR